MPEHTFYHRKTFFSAVTLNSLFFFSTVPSNTFQSKVQHVIRFLGSTVRRCINVDILVRDHQQFPTVEWRSSRIESRKLKSGKFNEKLFMFLYFSQARETIEIPFFLRRRRNARKWNILTHCILLTPDHLPKSPVPQKKITGWREWEKMCMWNAFQLCTKEAFKSL